MKKIILFSLVEILFLASVGAEANSLWTEKSGSYFIKPKRQFVVGIY